MRLLLDTQAFIRLVRDPTALPDVARSAIGDPGNELLLSLPSPWEIQIKVMLGKLTLGKPLHETIQTELDRNTFALLPVTLSHIDALSRLPSHHRDPFDRILVAQAIHEGLTLITGDRLIPLYPVNCLWD